MKLTEALQILNEAESSGGETEYPVLLACGFAPLHLETFLAAHLKKALAGRRIKISGGLYGDLAGTLERGVPPQTLGVVVVLEWPDLDARLGYRALGGWGLAQEAEIPGQVQAALARLGDAIERLSQSTSVAVSLPALLLPPAFHTCGNEAGNTELQVRAEVQRFATRIASYAGVAIANDERLRKQSPPEKRHDLRSELLAGHPYSVAHDDAIAQVLASLLLPAPPRKGLITDLDDTLWHGLVGEIGAEAVTWDLDNHAQVHGLYQQLLAALAEQGVLLGVASKNDRENVEQAFRRPDIRVSRDQVFPMEAHWSPKSESVGRILATWNIGADSVVFVDDNPMELGEVKAAWPEIDCLLFPKNDPAAALELLRTLRDRFGKRQVNEEDRLRLLSIRSASELPAASEGDARQDEFLSQAGAELTICLDPPASDSRVLELVNKTNQFNLNGRRFSEDEWKRSQERKNALVVLVSYEDKFGPLGKIAVLAGTRSDSVIHIDTWVMSCRAFSRRIEFGCLDFLFSQFNVDELEFEFTPTAKNGPLRAFLAQLMGAEPDDSFVLRREQFREHCPSLYFQMDATV